MVCHQFSLGFRRMPGPHGIKNISYYFETLWNLVSCLN